MTVQTKKILVAVLLCLVFAVTVTLGVFSFIPNFDINDFGDYYQSPLTVIQKSSAFTDSVTATYNVKINEESELNGENVASAVRTRLSKTYGYYGASVDFDEEKQLLTVTIPKTNNTNTQYKASAQTILNNVIVNGKVEILSTDYSSSPSYSEDSVVLSQEHFGRASVRSYLNDSTTLYVCRVRLTKEGRNVAEEQLVSGTPYTCAIDGTVETWVYWSGSELQITYAYSNEVTSREHANAMAAYIGSGQLDATLTQEGRTEVTENKFGWIFLVVFGAIVLASFVFFAVRYKGLCIIPILTQALAIGVFMFFGALVHLEIFNVAAAVGVILAYAFMTVFSVFGFEKIRTLMASGKNYSVARYQALSFSRDNRRSIFTSLIAHAALLVLGIILWVIPTLVTAPLGNVFVYGAVLSFVATFCLNRLFAFLVSPFFDSYKAKGKSKSKK